MADVLLFLDIHKESVAAVVVDSSSKITLVTHCAAADTVDRPFAEALEQIKVQTGFAGGPCWLPLAPSYFRLETSACHFRIAKK